MTKIISRHHTIGLPKICVRPISSRLRTDSFQLLPTAEKNGIAENDLHGDQLQDVHRWWSSERYKGIKRPYSVQDVVDKRGSLQQTYPSSLMARKLFNLLKEKGAAGKPVHTCKITIIGFKDTSQG